VLGVAGAFGPGRKLTEGSYRVVAARITERRVSSNPEQ
jgi:hypothetical protein